jgi:phosphatidylethanolamine/phosphatidyl-N-methylethanolamine N-methyltransferase
VESQLQHKRHSAHHGAFFKNWLQDPFQVASIVPSSRSLARLMATDLHSGARVVELGAGTGTLTQALLERGVLPEDLYLVENNDAFARILGMRFPGATIVHAGAETLNERLESLAGTVDYVISGLPIVWFDKDKKTRILDAAFTLLKRGGALHQFTYLGKPPVGKRLMKELRLDATLIGLTVANFPPAFVYRFTRR